MVQKNHIAAAWSEHTQAINHRLTFTSGHIYFLMSIFAVEIVYALIYVAMDIVDHFDNHGIISFGTIVLAEQDL